MKDFVLQKTKMRCVYRLALALFYHRGIPIDASNLSRIHTKVIDKYDRSIVNNLRSSAFTQGSASRYGISY